MTSHNKCAPVAQRTEQGFPKPKVAGPNPAGGTIFGITAEEFVKASPMMPLDPAAQFYFLDFHFAEEEDYTGPSGVSAF